MLKEWMLVLMFLPLAFIQREEPLDIYGKIHSLLNSSFKVFIKFPQCAKSCWQLVCGTEQDEDSCLMQRTF